MRERPIGVFDSGIGGLTVVRQLLAALPRESIVYFGDTARVPYGTKSADTVTRFSREAAHFLARRKIKLLIVACNSASAVALPTLQREWELPMMGVILPGARAAARATRGKKVAVVGT
ncbi:MAG: aspartate/glutamate racemase family protein, partial [Candidatus Eisenbacteria bacterium]|nr:aspartate/glutamate racemase family protein [Candidatus Eisenbacteria bacterium]